MFKDRIDAGALLAKELLKYKNTKTILLAIPRGGVPVAHTIAKVLSLPTSLVLVKKIGHPINKEYAIGAVNLDDYFINDQNAIEASYIEQEVNRIRKRLKEMQQQFIKRKNNNLLIEGKNIILVDDGIATGNTIISAVHLIRKKHPRKVIVAAPVASKNTVEKIKEVADEVIIIETPSNFRAIGQFYTDFEQVTDEKVVELMNSIENSKSKIQADQFNLALAMKYFPLFN